MRALRKQLTKKSFEIHLSLLHFVQELCVRGYFQYIFPIKADEGDTKLQSSKSSP